MSHMPLVERRAREMPWREIYHLLRVDCVPLSSPRPRRQSKNTIPRMSMPTASGMDESLFCQSHCWGSGLSQPREIPDGSQGDIALAWPDARSKCHCSADFSVAPLQSAAILAPPWKAFQKNTPCTPEGVPALSTGAGHSIYTLYPVRASSCLLSSPARELAVYFFAPFLPLLNLYDHVKRPKGRL